MAALFSFQSPCPPSWPIVVITFDTCFDLVENSMSAAAGGALGEAHRVGGDVVDGLSLLSR